MIFSSGDCPMNLRALVALSAVVLLVAADAKEDTKKDNDKIQGAWKVVKGEKNGKEASEDELKDMVLTFKGDKLTITEDKGKPVEGTFKLDAGPKLREIDITFKAGEKERTMKGIYALDGDELKICMPVGSTDKDRPKEFTSKEGFGILTLKREKK
jgi:uncharacterized protein (TIGR03067 family)